ncbi:MAG: tRNA preQ1(34) S-adenosylmethionine ribosyltransferase-isomerase QueA [Cyanobacteria bacterium]|nr:tRNA preQ1(34) S-adenosylmethionine ribosyltransferase-isomerase QueA [Cyanobacteriota bacterium]
MIYRARDTKTEGLNLSDYDFDLPFEAIARYPLKNRDQSKLMQMGRKTGAVSHHCFSDLPKLLQPGDHLVLNNTQVIPARLFGTRRGYTGKVEILLLNPVSNPDPDEPEDTVWEALVRPSRKIFPGTEIIFGDPEAQVGKAYIQILDTAGRGDVRARVHLGPFSTVYEFLEAHGEVPIPPYLKRESEPIDKTAYQTVFAKVPGSKAAPTAGLHFTPSVLSQLKANGIQISEITLSVSSGTFRSVRTENIREHKMDPEFYELTEETAQALRATQASGGRIIAVGTTVLKTLESVAAKYQGEIQADSDWSTLFIYPGFQFHVADGMLTNFHTPKSTLMMLVSAFSDRNYLLDAYRVALENDYRFYSYGDCMLIL